MLCSGYIKTWGPRAALAAVAGLCAVSTGCSSGFSPVPEPASQVLAEDGTDEIDLASRVASITASFVSIGQSTHLKLSTVRASTSAFYSPSGCLTPTSMGESAVHVHFDQCGGPWGLANLSGDLVVEQAGDQLSFTASNFQLGVATVTFSAQANITFDGADRKMVWSASLTGATDRGRPLKTSAVLTLGWQLGGTCITANGESQGYLASSPVSSSVRGLQRCDNSCPATGQVWIWPLSSPGEESAPNALELSFTGTGVAYFEVGGGSNPVQLSCGL
jgi:hypothetical protein